MADGAIELFYSYAPEDEALQKQLDKHLKLLSKQGVISAWHKYEILPGSLWQQDISNHLQSARIILFLVSPDFIASDDCYNVELKEAMRRHEAGEALVVPIILRPCDWKHAIFRELQALPRDGRPITTWPNRDAAFTEIVQELRTLIENLNSKGPGTNMPQDPGTGKRQRKIGKGSGEMNIQDVPKTPVLPTTHINISSSDLKPAINRYYKELEGYKGKADYELALKSAFQNLLADTSRQAKWTLIPEQTIDGGIRPDGVLRDNAFNLRRGFWEAKGPKSDLENEIRKKIADGYPLTNTIFENTKKAVLYQSKRRFPAEFDLQKPNDVSDLLLQFLRYTEPDIENFEVAVEEFKERIPELAEALLDIIAKEHKLNKKFITAFNNFETLCRSSLDPQISKIAIDEMLVQHLLTKRLFRTVFGNSEFINRNVIAAEIEKVIQALTSRVFNADDFLKSLDRFYVAIEGAAKGIESWSERQGFLNTVYERFFQGFSVKQADTHGIVYTPQEIVDFMCASVEEVLKREFATSIAEPGVQMLDPATGTGNFIVNLIRYYIPRPKLKYKYANDLFCNEIMLLPYYIASLNVEHEYYERMGQYEPFEGICFADTLELAEGPQQTLPMFVEENTERVQREKEAQIMIVIGNPPYNAWQKNESDNNKNRSYRIIDERIRQTYVKDSKATLRNMLYDVYVKFFRWATDRLHGRDGIICFISNNSFVEQIAFDGMRKHLMQDFTKIYHLDLHGNVRKNPKLSGSTHNVFGIQVGVGITVAIRKAQHSNSKLFYHRVPEYWSKAEKLRFLQEKGSISGITWEEMKPDNGNKYMWLTKGIRSDFIEFMPLGSKEARLSKGFNGEALFKIYSSGVATHRDNFVYSFDVSQLQRQAKIFVDTYNGVVDAFKRQRENLDLISLIDANNFQIKWTRQLKGSLTRHQYSQYADSHVRDSLYRPFTRKKLYFDDFWNEERYQQYLMFPNTASETENTVIGVAGPGADHQTVFATNLISDTKCGISGNSTTQCFPYYIYAQDGNNRRENITDWALKQFQDKYGEQVSKWDIFHYIYGILHHPQYRERYTENLKRDLPHIPLLKQRATFDVCVSIGKQLMDLHVHYEQAKEYPLTWLENKDVPFSWRVEKMRLSTDRRVVVVNESLRLGPLPQECFEYRLGNRSALEWVIDQYQVSKDSRSGIESDPNSLDDEEYIVRLVGKVVTVSVETVRLVKELEQAVTMADWLDESVEVAEETP